MSDMNVASLSSSSATATAMATASSSANSLRYSYKQLSSLYDRFFHKSSGRARQRRAGITTTSYASRRWLIRRRDSTYAATFEILLDVYGIYNGDLDVGKVHEKMVFYLPSVFPRLSRCVCSLSFMYEIFFKSRLHWFLESILWIPIS